MSVVMPDMDRSAIQGRNWCPNSGKGNGWALSSSPVSCKTDALNSLILVVKLHPPFCVANLLHGYFMVLDKYGVAIITTKTGHFTAIP